MTTNISFTNLDFFENKDALKEYLRRQDRFKDYDFEGSNMNVLLDVLSYNTFLNNYYVHAAFSEMFLDTAQLRENLNSHAKELNYLPQSRQSSMGVVDVEINVPRGMLSLPNFLTIPRNTQFVGKCNGETFSFYNKNAVTVYPVNGVYRYNGLPIYEGNIVTETYVVDDSFPQKFVINSDTCDISSIRVFVRDNVNSDSRSTEFVYKGDMFGVEEESPVFYLHPYLKYKYVIEFGRNVVGKQPEHGNIVTIEYRSTVGEEANGVKVFSISEPISGYQSMCYTANMSINGKERESVEDIRFFAPKHIQIQQRTVTESDYGILLKNEFGEIQAVNVFGGEKDDPPQFGRVIVAVDTDNAYGVSAVNRQKYYNFLKERTPLAIEPVIVAAEFMYLEVVTNVVYNTALTSKSSPEIRVGVLDAIRSFSDVYLNEFGKTFRYSMFTKSIDNSDDYIISNSTKLRAIIEYIPSLLSAETFDIKFNNSLNYDHGIYVNDIHYPAIKSSNFTYNNQNCYFIDDGNGIVKIVTNTASGNIAIVKDSVGIVDYNTGTVTIKNFIPQAYSGTSIMFYANVRNLDIVCPDRRIVLIRDKDVTINISQVRE